MTHMSTDTYRWFNHNGEILTGPVTPGRPTTYRWDDQLTHLVFGQPSAEPQIQAMTRCGKRVLDVPGAGQADCPECLDGADVIEVHLDNSSGIDVSRVA